MTAPSDGMVTPATRPSRPEKRDAKKIREQVEIIVIYDIFSKSIAESPFRAEKSEWMQATRIFHEISPADDNLDAIFGLLLPEASYC